MDSPAVSHSRCQEGQCESCGSPPASCLKEQSATWGRQTFLREKSECVRSPVACPWQLNLRTRQRMVSEGQHVSRYPWPMGVFCSRGWAMRVTWGCGGGMRSCTGQSRGPLLGCLPPGAALAVLASPSPWWWSTPSAPQGAIQGGKPPAFLAGSSGSVNWVRGLSSVMMLSPSQLPPARHQPESTGVCGHF